MKTKSLSTIFILLFVLLTASGVIISNMEKREDPIKFKKGDPYTSYWEKVAGYEKNGLVQSAQKVVDEIFDKAKSENNYAQLIKAMLHRTKYAVQTDDDGVVSSINKFKAYTDSSVFPLKPVLQSILGEFFWQYYSQNRWVIQQRTNTGQFIPDDIATWDTKRLIEESIKYYKLSVENTDSLERTDVSLYDDILIANFSTRIYRKTLFDFLAHRAVDFFSNSEVEMIYPSREFILNDEKLFLPAQDFSKYKIPCKDSSSVKFLALGIYQKLIGFHIKYGMDAALVDADLKRLKFVHDYSNFYVKDSLYEISLNRLIKKYENDTLCAEILWKTGEFYFKLGETYQPVVNEKYKPYLKKSFETAELCISKFKSTFGAFNCIALKNKILSKTISFTLEKNQLPDKPVLASLNFKNIDSIYIKIVKIDWLNDWKKTRNIYDSALVDYYLKKETVKTFNVNLPDSTDYQDYSTEIALPALPAGQYFIIAGCRKDFKWVKNGFAYSYMNVTNLSYLSRRYDKGGMSFLILNRLTGMPESGVTAQLWKEEYSYIKQQYDYHKSTSFTTDADGFFTVPAPNDYRYFFIELTKGNDRLVTDESFYQYKYYDYDRRMYPKVLFFTDRSIYRPGQTLYFKGIIINTDGTTNKIMPGFKTTVTLYDVNYQKVEDIALISNEYGSIQGTFTLPSGMLNGMMSISANGYGTHYFSVEEYKRPKFEVTFDTIKETFRLKETVKISGEAKTYAGSSVDNATVNYRVVRRTYFPYRWWYWWSYPAVNSEHVIKYGSLTTDADGKYTVEFVAEPDLSVNSKYSPAFTYSISADVVDINGETRSAATSVNIGYKSLILNTNLYDKADMNTTGKIEIYAKNLNGNDVQATGTVAIYKLNQPSQIFVKRNWNLPDVYTLGENEFRKLFPLVPYKNEDSPVNWNKGKKMFESQFDTKKQKSVNIPDIKKWEQGYYFIELKSKDRFGEDVESQDYVIFYDTASAKVPFPSACWFTPLKYSCEPGEKASFLIGSSNADSKILYEIEHKGKILKREYLNINNEQKYIDIPVTEEHRGNLSVHFTTINNNRYFINSELISVPYTNKELDISFESFRKKLYPGENEEWKIIVKGKKNDMVAAEMVATLYDASLDAFKPHYWYMSLYPGYYTTLYWQAGQAFSLTNSVLAQRMWYELPLYNYKTYDYLNTFGLQNYFYARYYYGYLDDVSGGDYLLSEESENMPASSKDRTMNGKSMQKSKNGDGRETSVSRTAVAEQDKKTDEVQFASGIVTGEKLEAVAGVPPAGDLSAIQARKNFSETAFFFPNLNTNEKGEIIISFKVPEALTKWKMLGLAHTKDLRTGTVTNELITQKELMIMPNLPRFMRENDKIILSSKVSNMGDKEIGGQAQLMLFDAITEKPVDNLFGNKQAVKSFTVKKGQSAELSWELTVPEGVEALNCKIVAKAGKFTDGEENVVPVLINRMLVTESVPLHIRGKNTKEFKLNKLLNSGSSSTLKHHKVTLEFTANPAWYAVQALPYIIEYPYECAEQVFSRFYGNKLASHIANSSPKIKAVFDSWKNTPGSKALLSNLEKNQELKDVLLQETPWVLDAKDESTRKRRIGLLFDLNTMSNNLASALNKLEKLQCSNGGFMWFSGMPDDRYITQHIVTGFGHLNHLNVIDFNNDYRIWNMARNGVYYLDNEMRKDYEWIKKHYTKKEMEENHLSYIQIQYLYMRSFFVGKLEIRSNCKEAYSYFTGQAEKYWLDQSKYMQGMIALAFHRNGEKTLPPKILASLKEFAQTNEEMGAFWKDNQGGYYWYQAPIETQALLIEAFSEITNDEKFVDDMRVWLLKQKQTQDWKTTKATTEAIYALLLKGNDWLATEPNVEIKVGNITVDPKKMPDQKAEAGTGYIKTSWSGSDINPEMGKITVKKNDDGVSWGALYWQYFEQLDKITSHETPLKLNKKLFIQRINDKGKVLEEIKPGSKIKIGDKVIARIELRVDRNMEYIHMKDMRASGFEPINVISSYKWQDGLGYYETTKDASTNFFFNYLPKGTYVFEYPVRATIAGEFSNGICLIQCMYAPEFNSHSEGIKVEIAK